MNRTAIAAWNFSFFVLLSFYSIGTGMIESFLNYPSWYLIGPTEAWLDYRELLTQRIIPLLAMPALLLQTISNIIVIVYRPVAVPRWTVWITLLLLVTGVVSSAIVQIPIQIALDRTYNKEMLDELINSDLYLRVLTGVIRGIIILYMLQCIIKERMIQRVTIDDKIIKQ